MAWAAVRPPTLVSTWSTSIDEARTAPNWRSTSSENSVRRTRPNLRRLAERFVAHPYRIGDLCNAGPGPPRGLPVAR